jgi:hypothetical protein
MRCRLRSASLRRGLEGSVTVIAVTVAKNGYWLSV